MCSQLNQKDLRGCLAKNISVKSSFCNDAWKNIRLFKPFAAGYRGTAAKFVGLNMTFHISTKIKDKWTILPKRWVGTFA